MRSQIEQNKEILWSEMEKLGNRKMNPEIAERLGLYRAAYKTLHMLCQEDMKPVGVHAHAGVQNGLTRETALEWTSCMQNADGTAGPHWSMEQTEQARKQRGIDCDPVEFYAAMNMMYSDYCKAAEKVGAVSVDFYVYMAKAFLEDKDAEPHKLARYYHYIARK